MRWPSYCACAPTRTRAGERHREPRSGHQPCIASVAANPHPLYERNTPRQTRAAPSAARNSHKHTVSAKRRHPAWRVTHPPVGWRGNQTATGSLQQRQPSTEVMCTHDGAGNTAVPPPTQSLAAAAAAGAQLRRHRCRRSTPTSLTAAVQLLCVHPAKPCERWCGRLTAQLQGQGETGDGGSRSGDTCDT